LNWITVKFWNVYGIEQELAKAHVITDFILKARDHRCIDMMTDGTEERQFLYAADCSECLFLLSQSYETLDHNKALHITSFEWTKILDVAGTVAKIFPGTVVIPNKSKDDVQKGQRNEPDAYILQYWKPRTSLREGIVRIVDHMTKASVQNKR
jgi:nucleoside-diphosphate-sugar epimerase